uniref:Uncharacterized protein n=1 Tax=Octopus bimaculoides TaxID=37653 RepID=A0A0L8G4B8_OCTBM
MGFLQHHCRSCEIMCVCVCKRKLVDMIARSNPFTSTSFRTNCHTHNITIHLLPGI